MTHRMRFHPDRTLPSDPLDFERDVRVHDLAAALRSLHSVAPPDTSAMDAVLRAALTNASHTATTNRTGKRFSRRWLGAAAAVVLLLVLSPRFSKSERALAGDVDRNGRVDILDAFAVARALEARTALAGAWDVNGDGAIDERDVALILSRAVSLGGDDQPRLSASPAVTIPQPDTDVPGAKEFTI